PRTKVCRSKRSPSRAMTGGCHEAMGRTEGNPSNPSTHLVLTELLRVNTVTDVGFLRAVLRSPSPLGRPMPDRVFPRELAAVREDEAAPTPSGPISVAGGGAEGQASPTRAKIPRREGRSREGLGVGTYAYR